MVACVALAACSPPEERAAAYLAEAKKLFDEGDYVKARLEARNAVQIEPKNAQARYLLALIAEKKDEFNDMLNHLLVAVDSDPNLVEARIKLGTLFFFGQAYPEAADQARAALELAPGNPEVRVLQAQVLQQQGDKEGALAEVAEALKLDPDFVPAIGVKASILAREDPDQALSVLDEGINRLPVEASEPLRKVKLILLGQQRRTEELERELVAMTKAMPDEPSYQVRLARHYRAQGRADEAERILRELVATGRESEDMDARLELVQFLYQVRSPEAVEEALKSFIEKEPENQRLRLALAQFYDEHEKPEEAAAGYEKVIAMDRRSEHGLTARNRLAIQSVRDGDLQKAEEQIQEILTDQPDHAQSQLLRASLLITEEKYGDAVAALRIVLRTEPDDERALLLLARTHARMGESALAKDAYRRLLETHPGNVDGAREFVALAASGGNLAETEEVLRRIAETNAGNVQIGALLSEVLAMQGDWQAAETEARRIAAIEDRLGIGAYQLGQVLEGQKRHADAARAYGQALDKNPDDLLALRGLSRALRAQGKQDELVADLRARAKARPESVNARLVLGSALASQGKDKEALAALESVIGDQPGLPDAYLALADLHPDDANARVEAYRRGLAAIPGNPQLGFMLGVEYQGLGRVDAAIALFEDMLAANPKLEWAANDLAAMLLDYRYKDPASLERALRLAESLAQSDNPAVLDTVGWAYYRAGRSDEAVRYLERAAAGVGNEPAVQYHLGMAYLAAGNPVNARQGLERALAADTKFVGAEDAQRALEGLEGG